MSAKATKFDSLARYEATIDSMFRRAVEKWPERAFVIGDGKRITYLEMSQLVDVAAHGLQALGVGTGDRVAVWMSNIWEWIVIQFAVTRIGAVLTPLNTRLRIDDLRHTLEDSGACVLVTQERSREFSYVDIVRAIIRDPADVPALRHVVVARAESALPKPFVPWSLFIEGAETDRQKLSPEQDPRKLAYILYTSGTTSLPKGVMLSHVSLNNAFNLTANLQDGDVAFMASPLFAITGCHNTVLSLLLLGGCIVLQERFDPDEAIGMIETYQATMIACIVNILAEMAKARGFRKDRVASLRTAYIFPRRPEHLELLRTFGLKYAATGYGMTETGGPVTNTVDLEVDEMESEGRPWPGDDVRVVDSARADVPAGAEGNILVRSPHVMLGYFNRSDVNQQMFDADGWLNTGDVGRLDANGRLRWVGRHSDMYKCSGFNVASLEVEAFLAQHPAISQVAVVGVPDAAKGEVGAAFVVASGDQTVDLSLIREFCEDRIASYKVPGHVIQLPALPRTASGKVRKIELKAMIERSKG